MTARTVTRFAPSPTGALHLGNARTALFNFLLARREGGHFVLRIEDTDLERSTEAFLQQLLADLGWLGLNWDLPAGGAEGGVVRQSLRGKIYDEYFARLEAAEHTYACFCSATELEISRRAQLAAGRPPRYAGTCRDLTVEQQAERRARGIAPTLRFRVSAGRTVEFADFVRGPQKFATDDIGDFIIRRADGSAQFFFCNAVDDALMGVTHVLRGEDHLSNTPRQILLLEALQLRVPHYGHVSLITGADGAPLSKRHGSVSVQEFRERGFLPQAIVNHLFRLGHTSDQEGWLALADMPAHFRVDHLGRAPARFDETHLAHWQKEALARAPIEEITRWLRPVLPASVSEARLRDFVDLVRHNVVLPQDAEPWVAVVFSDLPPLADEDRRLLVATGREFFREAVTAVERHGTDLPALSAALQAGTGKKGAALYKPLRLALTGRVHGPELAPLMKLLPVDTVRRRLEQWSRN
jgi:glutamyl-tRNA synthetase